MATWNPFGVSMDITAVAETVKRTSATTFTVKMKVSWACVSSTNKTDYGMKATSGGSTVTINTEGTRRHDATAYLTGTYTVDENVAVQDKSITVKFENFNKWHDDSASKDITLTVDVPVWTSYTVSYNLNGGTGTIKPQTKWHGENLEITETTPTRTGYTFIGWALSKANADTGAWYYAPGSTCGKNEDLTLYAVWKANTYTVTYNANGGEGAPTEQTKVYGSTLKLSSVKPTRTDYTFKGWAISESGEVAYAVGDNYTENSGVTLYAVWELNYTKPRITNLQILRFDGKNYEPSDEGEEVLVIFDWETDAEVADIKIYWKPASSPTYNITHRWGALASGTSGTVEENVPNFNADGDEAIPFDNETAYTFRIVVKDSKGEAEKIAVLPGMVFNIDYKPPKTEGEIGGTSVGKPAELDGVFDMGYKAKFREGYIAESLAAGTDLNSLLIPGWFVGIDEKAHTYINRPEGLSSIDTFALEVVGSGATGQIVHRLTVCSKENPIVYERVYYSGEWGQWNITGGHKPAISAYLSANQSTVASSYTKINFASDTSSPGLTLINGGIKIGEGISKVLVSLTVAFSGIKANGNKHIKILKNSVAEAWITGYGALGGDFTLTIPQRVISVSKGDVISATYYSINADEVISAGSSANGWKTCLTVEAV